MITQNELKELLHYDPSTGLFKRKVKTSSNALAGDIAGHIHKATGYVYISVLGKRYRAHRLAFLYMEGYIPEEVDHQNHIKSDNRFNNLASATRITNSRNMAIRSDNKSGYLGVSWCKSNNAWVSKITVNKRVMTLGYSKDKNVAITKRKEAELKYNFHKNHGLKHEQQPVSN